MIKPFYVFHKALLDGDSWDCYANSHQEAAENYGRVYDSDSVDVLAEGGEIEVEVRGSDGVRKNFRVYAEPTIKYFAEEI